MEEPLLIAPASDSNQPADEAGAILRLIHTNAIPEALTRAETLRLMPGMEATAKALQALGLVLSEKRAEGVALLNELSGVEALERRGIGLFAAGSAWFRLGRLRLALPFLQAAVTKMPRHGLAYARLGGVLLALNQLDEALPTLEKAVQLMPDSGGAGLNLARALLIKGEVEQALAQLERIAERPDKNQHLFLLTRADALLTAGRTTEAEQLLREAATGDHPRHAVSAVSLLASRDRHDEAEHLLREALEKHPEESPLLQMAADLALVRGRHMQAAHLLHRAIRKDPENAALWSRLAMMSAKRLDPRIAVEAVEKCLALTADKTGPERALALAAQGHHLDETGDTTGAEKAFRESLALQSDCVPALSGLGQLLMQLGRVDEAVACFEQIKERNPLQGWSQLIHARKLPDDPAVLESLERAARLPSLEGSVQGGMLFTLAAAYERKKEYAKAFECVILANEAARKHLDYRPEHHRQRIDQIIARFSKEFVASRADLGHDSALPVYVLGMPRSGTTLVEQILGSHSRIHGAGELGIIPQLVQKLNAWETKLGTRRRYPVCMDDLSAIESRRFAELVLAELQAYAPEASHVVDKLPHNFENIGLILMLFPKATIFHCRREARDIAVSNYFMDYGAKFGGMGFAYDLGWIGEQLVDHDRLMAHWHQVFPGRIVEVVYEELVEDTETWAKMMLEKIGVAWEPGVLDFQGLERQVKTASLWQVRQPVYTTSKAKWKRYESFLGALEEALTSIPEDPTPMPLPRLPAGLFLEGMEHLQQERYPQAEACFRRLVLARPGHAAAHHFLGAALFRMQKAEEAKQAMRRSLQLFRRHPQWYENLAKVETFLGHQEAAEKLTKIAARLRSGAGLRRRKPDEKSSETDAAEAMDDIV